MTLRHLATLALALGLASACVLWRDGGGGAPPTQAIDLNAAPRARVERLPGITPSMARRIVEARPYGHPEELVERGILTRREFERIEDLVTVSEPRR
jgi:competence protein ComEA